MSSMSLFYEEGRKKLYSYYYIQDLAIRSPLFAASAVPEPEARLLMCDDDELSVFLGYTEYGRPFCWSPSPSRLQNQHVAIIGAPGAGKSETMKTVIVRVKEAAPDVPVIVIDPEGEYEAIVRQLGYGTVIDIGGGHYVNIFDRPSQDEDYMAWAESTIIPGIMKAIELDPRRAPLMSSIIRTYVKKAYEDKGFKPGDPTTWRDEPTLKDLADLIRADVEPYIKGVSQTRDPTLRSKAMLFERLYPWVYLPGADFFAHKSTMHLSSLLESPLTVFSIKRMPEAARNLFTYFIFNYFYKYMERQPPGQSIKLFLMVDEGWILLKEDPTTKESPLTPMVRRGRKYGFSVWVATQQYKDIKGSGVLQMVGTVMILRIRDAEAVRELKDTLKLPDRIAERIPLLPRGAAVVSASYVAPDSYMFGSTPVIVRVQTAVARTVPVAYYVEEEPVKYLKRAAQS